MKELAPGEIITFPSRWVIRRAGNYELELKQLAGIITRGAEAIAGVYMRMCDIVRQGSLTDSEVREILAPYFPQPRISELLRVSRAPEEVYKRYTAGFFGFKAALRECRGYQITGGPELLRRKIARAAERLILLTGGAGEVRIRGKLITITQA